MRYVRFLIAPIMLLAVLSSCTKKEEIEEKENTFLGVWEFTEFRLDCPSEGLDNFSLQVLDGCMDFQGDVLCLSIAFESETEGMLTVGEGGGQNSTRPFLYTFNETQTIVSMCIEEGDCEEIEVVNDRLVLTESDPECPAEYFLSKQ